MINFARSTASLRSDSILIITRKGTEGATRKTQELNAVYTELKEYRKYHPLARLTAETDQPVERANPPRNKTKVSVTVEVPISQGPGSVSVGVIAGLKKDFRDAWQHYRQKPWDIKAALRLIAAAFRAGRLDAIEDLIRNEQLIDAAPILADIYSIEVAGRLALRWADRLAANRKFELAIQMLTDMRPIVAKNSFLAREIPRQLHSIHYAASRRFYSDRSKPNPSVRVCHLLAILELGFDVAYVHQSLAEAFHDLGQDDLARQHLGRAFELYPQLSGPKTIGKALGLIDPTKKRSARSRVHYRYSHVEDVPTPSEVFEWFQARNWDEMLQHAMLNDYSPKILTRARDAVAVIAACLGEHSDKRSAEVLRELATCRWRECQEAAFLSLAKVGDLSDVELLQKIAAEKNPYGQYIRDPLAYCEARIEMFESKRSLSTLLSEAASLLSPYFSSTRDQTGKLGRLRWELEGSTERHGSTPELNLCLAKCCLSMRDWPRVLVLLQPIAECNSIKNKGHRNIALQSHLAAALVLAHKQGLAIGLLRPIFDSMSLEPKDSVNIILQWALQSGFDSIGQEHYLWALETFLKEALKRTSPTRLLLDLQTVSRMMEPLGEKEMGLWLKHTLRSEAPGYGFGDPHDRLRYFASPVTSETFKRGLKQLCKVYQPLIIERLNTVLRSEPVVSPSDPKVIR